MKKKRKWIVTLCIVTAIVALIAAFLPDEERGKQSQTPTTSGPQSQTMIQSIAATNTTQSVGPNNSGQVAQIANSPGASVAFGSKAKEEIKWKKLLEINIPTNGVFKTQFEVTAINVPKMDLKLSVERPTSVIHSEIINRHGAMETIVGGEGTYFNVVTYRIEFISSVEVKEGDFIFKIDDQP